MYIWTYYEKINNFGYRMMKHFEKSFSPVFSLFLEDSHEIFISIDRAENSLQPLSIRIKNKSIKTLKKTNI